MKRVWQKRISGLLAALMLFGPGSSSWGDDGLWGKAKAKLAGQNRSPQYNYVQRLARCIDQLEKELLEDGTVVAKAPDVWGEARLTNHRAEFEEQFAKKVSEFEVRLNGSVARSDQAFLASALLLNASLTGTGGSTAPAISANQINNVLPGVNAVEMQGPDTPPQAPPAMNMYVSKPGSLTNLTDFAGFEESKIQLDQTIELDQMARYLNHLNTIRRMNEGDDTADSPGYSLNLVRIPVSIMPGGKTRKGHAAEITVTAEAHVTEELLPTTFRALVINDLVDQLTVPVMAKIRKQQSTEQAISDAYSATRNVLAMLRDTGGQKPEVKKLIGDLEWFTADGFESIVRSVNASTGPARIRQFLMLLEYSIKTNNQKEFQNLVGRMLPIIDQPFAQVFPQKHKEILETVRDRLLAEMNVQAGKSNDPIVSLIQGNPNDRSQQKTCSEAQINQLIATFEIDTASIVNLQPSAFQAEVASKAKLATSFKNFDLEKLTKDLVNLPEARSLLSTYSSVNNVFSALTNASAHRRARSPLTANNADTLLGTDLDLIADNIGLFVAQGEDQLGLASGIRGVLRDELETAYEALFSADICSRLPDQMPEIERAIVSGINLDGYRENVHAAFGSTDPLTMSMRSLLAWPILVESLLLSRQLNADLRHVSRDPDCQCLPPAYELPFYGLEPPAEARKAFVDYVKCRWPIHVFALDPMTQDQNISDQYSMRRELQLAMAIAVATGKANAQSASRYARRLEMDMETVALNRTAVAFGHGKDTFGWRFTPRVQTPDFEGNAKVVLRDLLLGGPNRDDLRNKWELEPGMRECVAVVLMPSFITHVRFDCRGQFIPMACDRLGLRTPSDTRTSVSDTVEMSRMIREMQHCAMHAMSESHLYRDGEVERLMRRVEQLGDRLPLQTCYSRVPNENTLGGFEMFSSGVTDLAPELYDWYGEPGYAAGQETTIFLIGSNFSVTGTRVIIGNRSVRPRLLSREVMEVTIPADVQVSQSEEVDIHVATQYGVSQHLLVPVKGTAAAPGLAWGTPSQTLTYRWSQAGTDKARTWSVSEAGIHLPRPHELAVQVPARLTSGVHIPADVTFNLSIALTLDNQDYLTSAQVINNVKYVPDRQAFVLDSTQLLTLHKTLSTSLVAKLQMLGHKETPPAEHVKLEIQGFITPTGGANPRIEIPGSVELTIQFQFVKP